LREARYSALSRAAAAAGARFVLTAHQADDAIETFLLALLRGSGIDGLTALRAVRPLSAGVSLLRPLLFAGKAQLAAYVGSLSLPVSVDETNADMRIRRNQVRALLQGLGGITPAAACTLERSFALLRDDRRLLDALTKTAWRHCSVAGTGTELSTAAMAKLPLPLLRRVIRYTLRAAGHGRDFERGHCQALASAIKQRRGGSFHGGANARVILSAGKFIVAGGGLTNGAERTRALATEPSAGPIASLRVPTSKAVCSGPWGRLELRHIGAQNSAARERPERIHAEDEKRRMWLNAEKLVPGTELTLRYPRAGDKFVPSGRTSATPLARYLAKSGVTREKRGKVLLLCSAERILAVLGHRLAAGLHAGSAPVLEVCWQPADD
jgi:hypothetical protein